MIRVLVLIVKVSVWCQIKLVAFCGLLPIQKPLLCATFANVAPNLAHASRDVWYGRAAFQVARAVIQELSANDMAQQHLRTVRRRAAKVRKAQDELAEAILRAHAEGESLRDIAEFAGWPYSRVYRLVEERRRQAE